MLLGRGDQIGRIDGLLRAAEGGLSAALIVHGEAGIGKTSLLEHVARSCETSFAVLRVRPLEAEADLPFAGLSDLVRPLHHLLEALPERQRAALSGALALGPPAPNDRFGVAAATLSLLATAADDAPVLAVIDDAHWLDAPSREALLFAGRRLAGEGVVVLFGTRDRAWLRGVGIDTLELHGLGPDDTDALLTSTGIAIDAQVRRQLAAGTGGNPLALLESIRALSADELSGETPLVAPLPVGAALEQAFALHLGGLPSDTCRAVLVAAASGTGVTSEIMSALDEWGLERAALEPAERVGLITVTEHVAFRHPLIRSAAYHGQDVVERRAAHRAFAAALGDGQRAAWHLAKASLGPDEQIAAELESSGRTALERSAYAAAGSAFETAAELSPDDAERLRRTLVAGRALWLGGESERAAALLTGVIDLATEPALRADLQQLRCAAMLFVRPVSETLATLIAEAERVLPHDRVRAATMFASASLACIILGDLRRAGECARRAGAAAEPDSAVATLVAPAMESIVDASLGGIIEPARVRLFALLEQVSAVEPIGEHFQILGAMAWTFSWIEEWTVAQELIERIIDNARAAGAPSLLPVPLAMLSELEFRRGRLAAAYAAAAESVQLAADTGQTVTSAHSLVMLAQAEAVLGHEAECRSHVAGTLALTRRTGARAFESYAATTLGLLELSHGRPERVAAQRAESARLDESLNMMPTAAIQAAPDSIEAYVRDGALAEASTILAFLETRAETIGLRGPRAAAARCRGLLAEDFEAEFATALELHGDDMPFERARTQLCLGMRRRRARRRAGARTALHQALAYFEAAGAEPWAEQARAELRASGETPEPSANGSLRSLTPQELQVALIVAKGHTNREAAASLFLSEKTVEFHLSNAYRKLGLRSRGELIRRVEGLP